MRFLAVDDDDDIGKYISICTRNSEAFASEFLEHIE